MKVKDLIELLRHEDPERQVCVAQHRNDYVGHTDAHESKVLQVVRCRVDDLGYNAPTMVEPEANDEDETYVDLLTLF